MKSINVIDLDKTLIAFDSFRYLVIDELKSLNLKIALLVTVRRLRLIDASRFKKGVIEALKLDSNSRLNSKMADLIVSSIDKKILEKIEKESSATTINILCSASANSYVKEVAKRLGWVGYGSYIDENNLFYHMYGANKLKFIESKYPNSKYRYNFAISDSKSDLEMLKRFERFEIIL